MRRLILLLFCAVVALGFARMVRSTAATAASAPGQVAVRALHFETLLQQLDPGLTTTAQRLRGTLTRGRQEAPERSITWTSREGAVMTARIWLTEVQGKATLHTSLEANRGLNEGMNQSFNLQYLQLQQQMQNENRQFTLVSNIMKTKHDTTKNSIGNIR